MAEKEAVLDSDTQDLNSIQTVLRQHKVLEVGNTQQAGRTLGPLSNSITRGLCYMFKCSTLPECKKLIFSDVV